MDDTLTVTTSSKWSDADIKALVMDIWMGEDLALLR